jgi:hypothetical protein
MDEDQLDAVAEPINDHWAEQMGDDARPFVEPMWHGSILPSLKVNALAEKWTAEQFRERCIRALRATVDLFYALHINAGSNYTQANEKPQYYWTHHNFNILRSNDATRGMSIQKDEMLRVAAEYLSHPEIRTNKFDWLLLDAIVFAELDAFSNHVSGFAATLANGNPAKYLALLALFKVMGFTLGYLLLPAIAYFAFSRGHETTGWAVAGLWVVSVVWSALDAIVFHLTLGDHMRKLDAAQQDASAAKILETQHRTRSPLDSPMVLLNDVIQILILSNLDRCVPFGVQRI